MTDPFSEYLSKPCDFPDCDRTATHNAQGLKVCNRHLPSGKPAFARND